MTKEKGGLTRTGALFVDLEEEMAGEDVFAGITDAAEVTGPVKGGTLCSQFTF